MKYSDIKIFSNLYDKEYYELFKSKVIEKYENDILLEKLKLNDKISYDLEQLKKIKIETYTTRNDYEYLIKLMAKCFSETETLNDI